MIIQINELCQGRNNNLDNTDKGTVDGFSNHSQFSFALSASKTMEEIINIEHFLSYYSYIIFHSSDQIKLRKVKLSKVIVKREFLVTFESKNIMNDP